MRANTQFSSLGIPAALFGIALMSPMAIADEAVPRPVLQLQNVSFGAAPRVPRSDVDDVVTTQLTRLGAYPFNETLVARIEEMPLAPSWGLSTSGEPGKAVSALTVTSDPATRFGLQLPRPDPWAPVVATLALGVFFFIRRIA